MHCRAKLSSCGHKTKQHLNITSNRRTQTSQNGLVRQTQHKDKQFSRAKRLCAKSGRRNQRMNKTWGFCRSSGVLLKPLINRIPPSNRKGYRNTFILLASIFRYFNLSAINSVFVTTLKAKGLDVNFLAFHNHISFIHLPIINIQTFSSHRIKLHVLFDFFFQNV